MGKPKRERSLAEHEAQAVTRSLRVSPQKLNLVAEMIRGKKVATAAGAVAGGYAGNQVQGNMQAGDTYTTTEQRCKTVQESSTRTIGYDVTYRLAGQEGVVRMEKQPGPTIPVKDGKLVLSNAQG